MAAAEYGSPPEIAGNAGAEVGLYVLTQPDGRPLTGAASTRNRV